MRLSSVAPAYRASAFMQASRWSSRPEESHPEGRVRGSPPGGALLSEACLRISRTSLFSDGFTKLPGISSDCKERTAVVAAAGSSA